MLVGLVRAAALQVEEVLKKIRIRVQAVRRGALDQISIGPAVV